jgi:hypothetical protein
MLCRGQMLNPTTWAQLGGVPHEAGIKYSPFLLAVPRGGNTQSMVTIYVVVICVEFVMADDRRK